MQPIPSIEENLDSITLTADDVVRLLSDSTAGPRIDVARKIAGAYSTAQLTDRENRVAEHIFRLLLRDTEVQVRRTLSESIKKSETIPRDIVMGLARDVQEVALPVLRHSEVLTDDDLADLIQHTEEDARFLAMAQRRSLTSRICDMLLGRGDDTVAAALVRNTGAEMSEQGFLKVIARQGENKSLMTAMGSRPRLPIAVAEKLVHVVTASLAEQLRKKYQLPDQQIEQEVEKVRESETLALVRISQSPEEVEKLVAQLIAFDRLTSSLILSALCQGNFAFFEISLARLSDIPIANARTLIIDRGELGFRAVYNKSGLPEAMFPAVRLLLRAVRELDAKGERPGSKRYPNRIVERLLQLSEETPVDNLSYLIALVRRMGT